MPHVSTVDPSMPQQKKHFRATEAFGANSEDVTTYVMLKLPRKCRGLERGLPCPTAKERRCACHNTIVRIIGLYNQCNGCNCHQNSESFYKNEHTLAHHQTRSATNDTELVVPRNIGARCSAQISSATQNPCQVVRLSCDANTNRGTRH